MAHAQVVVGRDCLHMWKVSECSKVKVKLSLCLINQALHHEGIWWSRCIDPHFLDLGASWRWVVSFTSWPLYPRGKSCQYPLDRRLGVAQSWSGRHGEEEIFDLPGLKLWPLGRPASSQSLYRLCYPGLYEYSEQVIMDSPASSAQPAQGLVGRV
jgi:hypothetical protein